MIDSFPKAEKLDYIKAINLLIMAHDSEIYLIISYNTELLQNICFNTNTAIKYLGREATMSLQGRHSDIQAARNVYELPLGTISIDGNLCTLTVGDLLFIEMTPNYPVAQDDEFYDWSTVGRVKFMGVNDVR